MTLANTHTPVMLPEVLEYIAPRDGGRYLDGTLGLGGHALGILERAGRNAHICGLDRDEDALAIAGERLSAHRERVHMYHLQYSRFDRALADLGWEKLDGALLDLGVSSLQLDADERGFSFLRDGPLDMRMDPGGGAAPASNFVNRASFERLCEVIGKYGEEPMGGRIARAIIDARAERPIETTAELAAIVEQAYPAKWRRTARTHPATRTFQALRMEVNDELGELQSFLDRIFDHMAVGGRVVIISFHSLEDRLVKRTFRDRARDCTCPRHMPICQCEGPVCKVLTKKPVQPSEDEVRANSRSRSAKLRAAERIEGRAA